MTKSLPSNPSLKHLRNEAKSILKAHNNGESSCCAVFKNLRQFSDSTDEEVLASEVSLAQVQFALALEYGFMGWREMKNHVLSKMAGDAEFPHLGMPSPGRGSGNTYARGMSSVLAYVGTELSYDEILGLSGVAFILQVDTSGPYVDGGLDCAWWPNDAWGFDLGLGTLSKAAGWELLKLRADNELHRADAASEYQRVFAAAVEKSLAADKPVLAEHDHCFIITAVDDAEPPLLGYGTRGKSTQFEDVFRVPCYPWGMTLLGDQFTPPAPLEVDLLSLRHILALFDERAQGINAPETRFSGRRAWSEWIRLLHEGHACDNNMLIHLRYNRGSAVKYLDDMAERHENETANHLRAAKALYQQVLDMVTSQKLPWNRVQDGEPADMVRSDYTAMVEKVAKLEEEAIEKLRAAEIQLSR